MALLDLQGLELVQEDDAMGFDHSHGGYDSNASLLACDGL